MADFPSLVPSSREYTPGDWPVRTYRAMDGYEVRILYGDKMNGMKLQLSYQAIPDTDAVKFLEHYEQQRGTFESFIFASDEGPKSGWGADPAQIGAVSEGNEWRYEGPPQLEQLRPGVSRVTVNLIAVLN